MEKQPIDITKFGGINKLHTRELGQASIGKNFWTKSGSLVTREGCSYLGPSFSSAIKSMHTGGTINTQQKLFVEVENSLYLVDGSNKTVVRSGLSGPPLDSVQYSQFIVFGNGNQMFSYNLKTGTTEDLKNISKRENGNDVISSSPVPSMSRFLSYRKYLLGFAPEKENGNKIYFNGPLLDQDGADLGMNKDVWPPDHSLTIGSSEGTSIIEAIPFNTHLFLLTRRNSWRIYGYSKDNFEVNTGGSVGVYGTGLAQLVGEIIIWVGNDKRVYAYSGSDTYPISQQIDELLYDKDMGSAFTHTDGVRFWLVFPSSPTVCFVFDLLEKNWYIHEFPFRIKSAVTYYGVEQSLYFGTEDGRILKLSGEGNDAGTPIETEFMIGPFDLESRKVKVKSLWVNSEARNDFNLTVLPSVDDESRTFKPIPLQVKKGEQKSQRVRMSGVKGLNISLKITSKDRISELQKLTLSVVPKGVK